MLRHTASIKSKRICFRAIAIALAFALSSQTNLVAGADLTVTVVDKHGNPVTDAVIFLMIGSPTEPGPAVKNGSA